jgi:peptidoglycan glycosyltransferase
LKQVFSRSLIVLAITLFFCGGLLLFYGKLAVVGDNWTSYPTNRHIYTDGHLVKAGTITDRNGEVLASTQLGVRSFHESESVRKATVHAVGDLDGFVSTGVHTAFWKDLTGYDILNGVYGAGHDMTLTIDSDLSVTACQALGNRAGTVGVYNYKTGEIICMVSTPTYDPENKPDSDTMNSDKYKAAYLNKFLSASFTPGSTFKIVTSACAIENIPDIYERTFTCDGALEVGATEVICNGKHGKQSFEKALNNSCNSAFAEISIESGEISKT